MSQYATLLSAIQNAIKQNGNKEITGAVLQTALVAMIESLGAGYQFMGVCTPSTNPGTPDQKVFYVGGPGTYANFGTTIEVGKGRLIFFRYAASWSHQIIDFGSDLLGTAGPYTNENSLTAPGFYWRNVPGDGYASAAIFVETAGNTINQIRLMLVGGVLSVKSRVSTDGGGSWSAWVGVNDSIKSFIPNITDSYQMDTNITPGIYQYKDAAGLYAVRAFSETKFGQWRIGSVFAEETGKPYFAYRYTNDAGATWTEWVYVGSVTFNGDVESTAALDSLIDNGVYRMADSAIGFLQRIIIVSATDNNIQQMQLSTNGSVIIRTSVDGGTTWTPWAEKTNYIYTTPDNEIDLLKMPGMDLGFSLSPGLSFQYAGTTRLYPIIGGKTLTITAGEINTVAIFFRCLPPTNPADGVAALAYLSSTETERRNIVAGTTEQIAIPGDAAFVVVGHKTTAGISNAPIALSVLYDKSTLGKDIINYLSGSDNNISEQIKKNGIAIKIGETIDLMNPNATPINDTFNKAAGENHYVIDRETGIAYVVYNEGVNSYYETTGLLKLCVFPLAQPWRAEWFELAKTEDGNVGTPINPNIVLLESGKVRCFITGFNYAYLAYKDFDITTKQFSALQRVQYNGADLSAQTLKNIIDAAGYSGTGQYVRSSGQMENCSDGTYKYQLFSDAESESLHPVILRSSDNFATVESMGVFPFETRYDATMAYYNGTFHILYRRGSATGLGPDDGVYLTTTQDFVTYTPAVRAGTMDMRPDIFAKTDGVYLVVGDKRNQGQGFYRTNMHILKGSGAVVSGYTKIINVTDDRGTVNPCAYLWGNNFHFIYGTSPLRLDAENGWYGQWQGKECTSYLRVRENV